MAENQWVTGVVRAYKIYTCSYNPISNWYGPHLVGDLTISNRLPSRERITYPTWGKGISSYKRVLAGDILGPSMRKYMKYRLIANSFFFFHMVLTSFINVLSAKGSKIMIQINLGQFPQKRQCVWIPRLSFL